MLTLKDIQDARVRIAEHVHVTDIADFVLPKGGSIGIKMENLQVTGAFKARGAFNKIMTLSDAEKTQGVLAASAGNHAQGVAMAAKMLGIRCTIVMPVTAPLQKVSATKSYGAEVVLFGETYDDACMHAQELAPQMGAMFIHPFDDEAVIAGQGTIGLEILEQADPSVVIVPIGGGGLCAGVALAIKSLKPHIKVIGVEPANAASMKASIQAKKPVTLANVFTIADGIAVKTPGEKTLELCRQYVDEIVTVSEGEIANAILFLLEKCKIVSEGAGASSVAAVLSGKVAAEGGRTVALLSGGNIDMTMVSRIIEKGLVQAGRKSVLAVNVDDRPGHLARLLTLISTTGANVFSIQHDRLGRNAPIQLCIVKLELETRDNQHIMQIKTLLEDAGFAVEIE